MADPDFELRWGPGFGLLALPAFLPSVISSFFTQNRGGEGGGAAPLGSSPRSATEGASFGGRYFRDLLAAASTIAHFRVALSLSIKARPGAQPFI